MTEHKNSATATLTHARNIATTRKKSCQKGSLSPAKKAVYLSCQKRQPTSPAKKMAAYPKKKKQRKKKEETAEEEQN